MDGSYECDIYRQFDQYLKEDADDGHKRNTTRLDFAKSYSLEGKAEEDYENDKDAQIISRKIARHY